MDSVVFQVGLGKNQIPKTKQRRSAFTPRKPLWPPVFNIPPLYLTIQEKDQPRERRHRLRENHAWSVGPKAHTGQGSHPERLTEPEQQSLLSHPLSKVWADPKSSNTATTLRIKPMVPSQSIQGISDLALAYLILCAPQLFIHYSFCLDHLLLNKVKTWNSNSSFQI